MVSVPYKDYVFDNVSLAVTQLNSGIVYLMQ